MASPVKLVGFARMVQRLERFPKKQATPALRKAVRAGTALIRAEVKAATPVDEGVLKRAQDFKVSVKGFRGYGVTGANLEKLKQAHATDPARPTNIDWLVENGHVAPDGTFIPPSGYMRRAAASAMPKAELKAIQVLSDEIDRMRGG